MSREENGRALLSSQSYLIERWTTEPFDYMLLLCTVALNLNRTGNTAGRNGRSFVCLLIKALI